ncbi:MAG TPA: hypothetical protein VHI77_11000 [Solirubrobacterales bacterium]|nr:hypothetical protein [Solirubrobacterales bacterium]
MISEPTRWLAVLALAGVGGVIFGGWALLTFIAGERRLSAGQVRFFRAGHAHAGVLLVLSLVCLRYLPETGFSNGLRWAAGLTLLSGVLAQSGGFFLHLAAADLDKPSPGTKLTRLGAALIAIGLSSLGLGLAIA